MTVAVDWESALAWKRFEDFCAAELETGGPDHHRAVFVATLGQHPDVVVRRWRACLYVATYEINTAAWLAQRWPTPDDFLDDQRDSTRVEQWLNLYWTRLLWRRERRAARTQGKLLDCLYSCAMFCRGANEKEYEDLWQSGERGLRYMGRYALIKLFETWRRTLATDARCPDIRPRDAHSCRGALAQLFPAQAKQFNSGSNDKETLRAVQRAADEARERAMPMLASQETCEILLCNWFVTTKGDKEYPGRRLDTDLDNFRKSTDLWHTPPPFAFLQARHDLFPHVALGEKQGWGARRPELGQCWNLHGYHWSDVRYNYMKTLDLANPVKR